MQFPSKFFIYKQNINLTLYGVCRFKFCLPLPRNNSAGTHIKMYDIHKYVKYSRQSIFSYYKNTHNFYFENYKAISGRL